MANDRTTASLAANSKLADDLVLIDDLVQARRIVLRALAQHRAKVYLYGSVAKGSAGRTSDIDIAVLPEEPLPQGTLATMRQEIEESNIPYPIELVDLRKVDEIFRERVVREGILWSAP